MEKRTNFKKAMTKDNIFDNETIRCLLKSEEDIDKGRTKKATEVIKELRTKYGF